MHKLLSRRHGVRCWHRSHAMPLCLYCLCCLFPTIDTDTSIECIECWKTLLGIKQRQHSNARHNTTLSLSVCLCNSDHICRTFSTFSSSLSPIRQMSERKIINYIDDYVDNIAVLCCVETAIPLSRLSRRLY